MLERRACGAYDVDRSDSASCEGARGRGCSAAAGDDVVDEPHTPDAREVAPRAECTRDVAPSRASIEPGLGGRVADPDQCRGVVAEARVTRERLLWLLREKS